MEREIIEPILVKATQKEIISIYNKIKSNKEINKEFGNPTLNDYLEKDTKVFKIKGKMFCSANPRLKRWLTVGIVACSVNRNSCCVWSLYIKKQYRNQGFAEETLQQIVKCFDKDFPVYGFCDLNNLNALSFYIKRFRFLNKGRCNYCKISSLNELNKLYISNSNVEIQFNPFFMP